MRYHLYKLGTYAWNRFDEFSENFQTASDPPPPYFRKTMLRFFSGGTKICNKIFRIGVDPPPFPKICNEIFWIGVDPAPIPKNSSLLRLKALQ